MTRKNRLDSVPMVEKMTSPLPCMTEPKAKYTANRTKKILWKRMFSIACVIASPLTPKRDDS